MELVFDTFILGHQFGISGVILCLRVSDIPTNCTINDSDIRKINRLNPWLIRFIITLQAKLATFLHEEMDCYDRIKKNNKACENRC